MGFSVQCPAVAPVVSADETRVPVTSGPPASVVPTVSPAAASEVAEAAGHAHSSSSGHSSPLVQPIIVNPMEEGEIWTHSFAGN